MHQETAPEGAKEISRCVTRSGTTGFVGFSMSAPEGRENSPAWLDSFPGNLLPLQGSFRFKIGDRWLRGAPRTGWVSYEPPALLPD